MAKRRKPRRAASDAGVATVSTPEPSLWDHVDMVAARKQSETMNRLTDAFSGYVEQITGQLEDRALRLAAYHGAEKTELRAWSPKSQSANDEMRDERDELVKRQRDLLRNSPIARSLRDTLVNHILGPEPWSVQSITDEDLLRGVLTPSQAEEWREACMVEWARTSDSLDALEQYQFGEMARLALSASLDGDAFVELVATPPQSRRPLGFGLRLHEGDLIRTPTKRLHDPLIVMGVRHDRTGKPISYYLFDSYESDFYSTTAPQTRWRNVWRTDREGRWQVLHLFRPQRIGQARGLPVLTPVLNAIDDLSSYHEARIVLERMLACIGLILRRQSPLPGETVEAAQKRTADIQMRPGGVMEVGPGQSLEPFLPNSNVGSIAPMTEHYMNVIAASLGFSAMMATRDFSKANYSVSRAIMLDARKTFEGWQRWFARSFYHPIYQRVIEEAWLDGRLPEVPLFERGVPSRWYSDLMAVKFHPPAFGFVDPQKDVDAYSRALKAGIISHREVMALLGRDWYQTFKDLGEEVAIKRELGIPDNWLIGGYREAEPVTGTEEEEEEAPSESEENEEPDESEEQNENEDETEEAEEAEVAE